MDIITDEIYFDMDTDIPVGYDLDIGAPITKVSVGDYNLLDNKPSIEGVELIGNRELDEIGLGRISGASILALFNR